MVLCFVVFEGAALGLSCGTFQYPKCDGSDFQFDGGFDPQTGFGGFGGGTCRASRTPVIFIHGNGDRAVNWDSPAKHNKTLSRSVYQEFKARGYNDCELFGITYLSPGSKGLPRPIIMIPESTIQLSRLSRPSKFTRAGKRLILLRTRLGCPWCLPL